MTTPRELDGVLAHIGDIWHQFEKESADSRAYWRKQLAPFPTKTLHQAIDSFVESGNAWPPSLPEMIRKVHSLADDGGASYAQTESRHRNDTCGKCISGWIPDLKTMNTYRPCPTCRSTEYDRWAKSLFMPRGGSHDADDTNVDPELVKLNLADARQVLADTKGKPLTIPEPVVVDTSNLADYQAVYGAGGVLGDG